MQPVQKPIASTLLFEHRYRSRNKQIEQKHDVGDPCLTSIIAVTKSVPSILFATLYIAAMANGIVKPYPTITIIEYWLTQ